MARVYIDYDEFYPVYFITNGDYYMDAPVDFTEEQLAFIKEATDNFWKAQDMLELAYKDATGRD